MLSCSAEAPNIGERYRRGVFREALPADFDAIARLYGQLNPDDPPVIERALFATILGAHGLRLFVLEQHGSVVATTYLNLIPNLTRGARPYAVVENVVVDEAYRGEGLGKAVMAGTLHAAWAAGAYKAMLMTGSSRASTHAFYRACGFAGDVKTAYVAHPARADGSASTSLRPSSSNG